MCINPAKADYEAQEQRYEAEKKAILARHGLELGHCQPGLPAGATPLLSVETPGLRKTLVRLGSGALAEVVETEITCQEYDDYPCSVVRVTRHCRPAV